MTTTIRVHTESGKSMVKNFVLLVVSMEKIILQTWSFDMHDDIILFWHFDNFTFIVLSNIVPILELGVSFGKVQLWNCCDRKSRAACAQSFAPWQQATIEIMLAISYYCLLAIHIWWCYSSRTSRSWWITQSTQHHRGGCNKGIFRAADLG